VPPRKSKPKGPAPGEWKYTVGDVPHQLTAYERKDKGNAIYTRVWNGRSYSGKKALTASIRDAAGKIIPDREIVAQQLAVQRHRELVSGVEMDEPAGAPLTLAGGFRKMLHPRTGKYASETPHKREVQRAATLIGQVLGKDRRMDSIRHADYRTLWRWLANAHVAAKRKKPPEQKYGLRTAEIVCGVLQNCATWLQEEGALEPGDAMPAPRWKQALKREWEVITGDPVAGPAKPRYTDAESRALWKAVAGADPRLRLAMMLGAELRLGQVARVRRSDIRPSPDGLYRIGALKVHGRGKKLGETIVLIPQQRHALTAALLWGFLADAEAAHRAGEIEDFYLIPGGRLHKAEDHRGREVRRVRPAGAMRPLTRRALARHWEKLEEAAEVDHVDGRLWYGMRRLQADKADALEGVSARAKNRMGGWSKTSTREGYLEQANLRDAEEAARARRMIRPDTA
jgi:hypothetical protein